MKYMAIYPYQLLNGLKKRLKNLNKILPSVEMRKNFAENIFLLG